MRSEMRFSRILILLLAAILVVAAGRHAASFLVLDEPEKSDAMVVLAGETRVRPARAIELLRQGVAPHVFLNVQTREVVYEQRLTDIAQQYVNNLGESGRVSVCSIGGFSTFAEADDVRRCLESVSAHRVLIVTSDYHTRRSLMILRHRLPQYEFHAAAAYDPARFGADWWTSREWAKVTLEEWSKMTWFVLVDRWR